MVRPVKGPRRDEVEALLKLPDVYGFLDRMFQGQRPVSPWIGFTPQALASRIDADNLRWEKDLQHGKLPYTVARRETAGASMAVFNVELLASAPAPLSEVVIKDLHTMFNGAYRNYTLGGRSNSVSGTLMDLTADSEIAPRAEAEQRLLAILPPGSKITSSVATVVTSP